MYLIIRPPLGVANRANGERLAAMCALMEDIWILHACNPHN